MNRLVLKQASVSLEKENIFRDISFSVTSGEFIALLGPNGVGKTTLMRAVAGLLDYEGSILLNGAEVREMSSQDSGKAISYIPQGHEVHWPMCSKDIVALGRLPYRTVVNFNNEEDEEIVRQAMIAAEAEEFSDRQYNQLSGGEKSRVMIARALANGAPMLLADEPIAALDPYHQLQILEMLRKKVDEGLSLVVILHDILLAGQFADRIILMHENHIIADGKPEEALRSELLERVYKITPTQEINYKRGLWERVCL